MRRTKDNLKVMIIKWRFIHMLYNTGHYLKNTGLFLLVGFIYLILLFSPSICWANVSESSIVEDSNAVEVRDSAITVELKNNQPSITTIESLEDYITVHVTESPHIDTIISALSCVFSFTALFLSLRSYKQTSNLAEKNAELQRSHNRDEVRPFVCIAFNASEPFSITIKNHGLGPAILKSMKWTNKKTGEEEDTLYKLLLKKLIEEFEEKQLSPVIYFDSKPFLDNEYDRDVLALQEERCFLKIFDNQGGPEKLMISELFKQRIAESLRDVVVVIEYTDIYFEETWKVIKDCTWFSEVVNGYKDESI